MIVFFWIKNKTESIFQLTYILSIIQKNKKILIIGKNKFGIKSITKKMHEWMYIKKILYKKKCTVYLSYKKKKVNFALKNFFKKHILYNQIIITLPGVFGYKKIDPGSILLISTFNKSIQGKVLDVGSGSGILSVMLHKKNSNIKLTLIDNNSTALLCSRYSLKENKIIGNVFYSNLFSHVQEKYNFIISNPPTHYGNLNNLKIVHELIKQSVNFLHKNGELRIILHSNISCTEILLQEFGNYKILKQKNHYKVYQSIL